MTKKECEKALENAISKTDTMNNCCGYIGRCIKDGICKFDTVDDCVHYKTFDTLKQLIAEHFDNPPLSFEELTEMVGFPVWDDKEKMWFIVSETFKPLSFYFPIYEDALSIKLVNNEYCSLIITNNFEYHKKFEENRFYRRQKEDLR